MTMSFLAYPSSFIPSCTPPLGPGLWLEPLCQLTDETSSNIIHNSRTTEGSNAAGGGKSSVGYVRVTNWNVSLVDSRRECIKVKPMDQEPFLSDTLLIFSKKSSSSNLGKSS